jgi:hypothetical protein
LQPLGKRYERGVRGFGPVEHVTRDENGGRRDLDYPLDRLVKRTSDIGLSDISALLHSSERPIAEVQI